MIIKPIEKTNYSAFILKLLFLISLVGTGILLDRTFIRKPINNDVPVVLGNSEELKKKTSNLVDETLKQTEKFGESVLGEATNYVIDTTEKISSSVSDVIYQNSIGKVVDQIDKLPVDQQDRIRQEICK